MCLGNPRFCGKALGFAIKEIRLALKENGSLGNHCVDLVGLGIVTTL